MGSSSLTKDQTWTACIGNSRVLAAGSPWKSPSLKSLLWWSHLNQAASFIPGYSLASLCLPLQRTALKVELSLCSLKKNICRLLKEMKLSRRNLYNGSEYVCTLKQCVSLCGGKPTDSGRGGRRDWHFTGDSVMLFDSSPCACSYHVKTLL